MYKLIILINLIVLLGACESTYTAYIVNPEIVVPEEIKEKEGPDLISDSNNDYKYVTVKQNDGNRYTEILIPVFSRGQKIIVDYDGNKNKLASLGPSKVVPAPFANDRLHMEMDRDYKMKGYQVNKKADAVSLSKSRKLLESNLKKSNYSSALMITDKVLERYPSQVEFLRAKGSIYLLMGEKSAAITSFEKAQAVEYSDNVQYQIDNLLEK